MDRQYTEKRLKCTVNHLIERQQNIVKQGLECAGYNSRSVLDVIAGKLTSRAFQWYMTCLYRHAKSIFHWKALSNYNELDKIV